MCYNKIFNKFILKNGTQKNMLKKGHAENWYTKNILKIGILKNMFQQNL